MGFRNTRKGAITMIVIIKTVDINNVTIITDVNFGNIQVSINEACFAYIDHVSFINS